MTSNTSTRFTMNTRLIYHGTAEDVFKILEKTEVSDYIRYATYFYLYEGEEDDFFLLTEEEEEKLDFLLVIEYEKPENIDEKEQYAWIIDRLYKHLKSKLRENVKYIELDTFYDPFISTIYTSIRLNKNFEVIFPVSVFGQITYDMGHFYKFLSKVKDKEMVKKIDRFIVENEKEACKMLEKAEFSIISKIMNKKGEIFDSFEYESDWHELKDGGKCYKINMTFVKFIDLSDYRVDVINFNHYKSEVLYPLNLVIYRYEKKMKSFIEELISSLNLRLYNEFTKLLNHDETK